MFCYGQIWLNLCKTLIVIFFVKKFCLTFTEKGKIRGNYRKIGEIAGKKTSMSKCIRKLHIGIKLNSYSKIMCLKLIFKTITSA